MVEYSLLPTRSSFNVMIHPPSLFVVGHEREITSSFFD
jgi:hypothetical protein